MSKPLIHSHLIRRLPKDRPVAVPDPSAHLYRALQPHEVNGQDLFATATPAAPASIPYVTSQPLFFRTVVPPILVDHPRPGALTRFPDGPELRGLCQVEFGELLRRFSVDRTLRLQHAAPAPPMPLLTLAEQGVSANHFANHDLIAVQHLYGSTVGLMDALTRHGLNPSRATVIGKSYSTCFGAARALLDRGFRVPTDPLEQHPLEDHEAVMERTITAELERHVQTLRMGRTLGMGSTQRKLLVLDDGGQIIDLIHRRFPELLPHVTCVEQTTRGVRRLEALPAVECAYVPVAQEPLKLEGEMPLVGLSAFYEIRRKLLHLEICGVPLGKRVSLNGCGQVGREILEAFLRAGFEVDVFDPGLVGAHAPGPGLFGHDRARLVTDRTQFLREAQILASSTGAAPITLEDYRLLPDRAALFNVASSNDELSATSAIAAARREQPALEWWSSEVTDETREAYVAGMPELLADREYVLPTTGWLWGEFGDTVLPLGHVARRAQRDRVLHFADKDIFLAKSGFVVNLTDDEDPIPPEWIQVTRTALFLGCVTAVERAGEKGPHAIPEERTRPVRDAFAQQLSHAAAPTLWTPEWAQRPPHITRSAETPTLPHPLDKLCEGMVFQSPGHILPGGASKPRPGPQGGSWP